MFKQNNNDYSENLLYYANTRAISLIPINVLY